MTSRGWGVLAGALGFTGVLLGAFGAHGLDGLERAQRISAHHVEVYRTGVHYLQLHALALLGVAWLSSVTRGRAAAVAGVAFVAGSVLFSGSLVAFGLSPLVAGPDGLPWLGMITPFGGLGFLVGWVALALAARDLPARDLPADRPPSPA